VRKGRRKAYTEGAEETRRVTEKKFFSIPSFPLSRE
jgi:hypothetical protein